MLQVYFEYKRNLYEAVWVYREPLRNISHIFCNVNLVVLTNYVILSSFIISRICILKLSTTYGNSYLKNADTIFPFQEYLSIIHLFTFPTWVLLNYLTNASQNNKLTHKNIAKTSNKPPHFPLSNILISSTRSIS